MNIHPKVYCSFCDVYSDKTSIEQEGGKSKKRIVNV